MSENTQPNSNPPQADKRDAYDKDARAADQPAADHDHDHDLPPGFEPDFDEDDTYQDQGVQEVHVDGHGKAAATLIDFGVVEQFQGMGQDEAEIDADALARLIRTNYVSPSFDGLSGDDVREMKPTTPGALLDAIMNVDNANVEVDATGTAHVSTADDEGK